YQILFSVQNLCSAIRRPSCLMSRYACSTVSPASTLRSTSALAAGLISGSAASSRSGFSTPHLKHTFIALSLSGFPFGAPPYILGGAPSVKREVVVLVLEGSASRRGFRLLFRQRREPID